jgi:aldose 1-epimerase
MKYFKLISFVFAVFLFSCENNQNVAVEDWGVLSSGENVQLYTLRNQTGMSVKISNYGGLITHLTAPDRHGAFADVVLGFDSLSSYTKSSPYFGALIGRYGNRIAKGKFSLGNSSYTLAVNNDANHLHGGLKGFDKAVWKTEIINNTEPSIRLHYTSKDGEEGYPGNLHVMVTYTLTHKNELRIQYQATTDKTTVVNLTNHSYFNLNPVNDNILDQNLQLNADNFVAVDTTLIPIGIVSVKNTAFDFRINKTIGKEIKNFGEEQVKRGGGYDHCFVLNRKTAELELAATATDNFSGRKMEVFTTEPGIQLYTGNFLDGKLKGKSGKRYGKHAGFCLETQHFPDSPNQKTFPSVVLEPGQKYFTETVFKFSTL